jgi:hypothetical protein
MNSIQRLNYFTSQFLQDKDFQDEQTYHREMRHHHNRTLHTPGVVNGLIVSKAGDRQIKVSPGVAIDREGQEIVLLSESGAITLDNANTDVFVTIAYGETLKDPDSGIQNQFRRTQEDPKITFSTSRPSEASSLILMASVKLDKNGNIDNIASNPDNQVRTVASAAIAPKSIGTEQLRDGAVTKSQLAISPVDIGALATSGGDIKGSLTISGNVGIGTTIPTGKLSISGSGGDGKSVTIDSGEIKFRGDGIAHFSIFANRSGSKELTIENTGTDAKTGVGGTVLMRIQQDGSLQLASGVPIKGFSDNVNLSSNSSSEVPTVRAVKAYVDALRAEMTGHVNNLNTALTTNVNNLNTALTTNVNNLNQFNQQFSDRFNRHHHKHAGTNTTNPVFD